jgi:hypothetical protein
MVGAAVTVALVAVLVGWWLVAGHGPGGGHAPRWTASAVRDSLESASERDATDAVLRWALELARLEPRRSETQRRLAIAWHNYGALDRADQAHERPPVRTSLERIECEMRALAAADSARVLAGTDRDWIAAMRWTGMAYEFLGLPIDALDALIQAHRRRPGILQIEGPIQILQRRLVDPLETTDDQADE